MAYDSALAEVEVDKVPSLCKIMTSTSSATKPDVAESLSGCVPWVQYEPKFCMDDE